MPCYIASFILLFMVQGKSEDSTGQGKLGVAMLAEFLINDGSPLAGVLLTPTKVCSYTGLQSMRLVCGLKLQR